MTTNSTSDYDTFLSTFDVEDLASQLAGNLQSGLNACYECCDRSSALFCASRKQRGRRRRYEV